MVISLMPAVFAANPTVTVAASGVTKVEAENYPESMFHYVDKESNVSDILITGTPKDVAGETGEKYLYSYGHYPNGTVDSYNKWAVDFTVSESGYYKIATSHAGMIQWQTGNVKIEVDDDVIFTDTGYGTADIMQLDEKTVYLEAGVQHTYEYIVSWQSNYANIYLDYVSFEKISSEFDVASAAATTIQAESYPYTTCVHSDTTTHSVEGAVSGGIVTSDCTTHEDANGTNSWKVTLNVAATGIYDIKTVAGGALTDANGGVEIKIDGEAIITDTTAGALAAVETFAERIYLTAGSHEYSYTAKSISGKATATIDYVEITPVVAGTADPDTTGTPIITPPAEIIAGASATVSYTYAAGNTNPEGDSILRVMYNDGGVWRVDTAKTVTGGTGSIELPDHLAGYEVAVEFIPVDSTGKMGPVTSSGSIGTLSRVVGVSAAAITPSGSDFNATVTITNNSATSGVREICVILVQYDADGAMLGITNAAVSVVNGVPQPVTATLAKDPLATKVQMFIWNGTGYLDAGASVYESATTYMVP